MIDVALGDYEKTIYVNGQAPGISAQNLNRNENKTEELDTTLAAHLADKVHQVEIHGLRATNNKLEYFNGTEWKTVNGGLPVGNVSNFITKGDDTKVILKWTDPIDVIVDGATIAKWTGTKILRKTGSYPVNENDGVLVVDNGIRNQYSENGFVDTGLENNTTYYYMAFPYTKEGIFTVDEINRVEATPTPQKIYGVRVDEAKSNPDTRVTYIGDAIGFTPIRGNNGNLSYGSWENIIKEEFNIRPCVLQNMNVNYYIQHEDCTKREDGTVAILTGADGDVMTEIPPLWYKWTWESGTVYTIEISNNTFDGAAQYAHEVEDGYNLVIYYPLLLTQILGTILFKSTDWQTALGRGYVDGNAGYTTTGNTNTKGFMFGETTGKQQMKFLGIEDYWGNKLWWIDGLVTDVSYNILIGKTGFNDGGTGYTSFPSGLSANTAGYIDSVQGGNDKGFIIKTKNGSESTYYADYGSLCSSQVAYFGGDYSSGSYEGFAYLMLDHDSSFSSASIGARLFCKSNGKIYIGVYLGTEQSGKLRSISGTTPTDTETIGAFRTLARTNN